VVGERADCSNHHPLTPIGVKITEFQPSPPWGRGLKLGCFNAYAPNPSSAEEGN
jgi:hypothetical protein